MDVKKCVAINVSDDKCLNGTTETEHLSGAQAVWGNVWILVFFLSLVFLCCNLLAFVVIYRTRLMPFAIKFLTLATLFFDCAFVLIILLSMVASAVMRNNNVVLKEHFTELGRLSKAASWVTIAMMAVERVIVFLPNSSYAFSTNKTKVVVASVITWGICLVSKVIVRYVILAHVYRADELTIETGYILTSILGICIATCLACYVIIYFIVRNHQRRIMATNVSDFRILIKKYTFSRGVLVITLAFLVFYIPVFIAYISRLGKEDDFLNQMAFGMSLVASVVNPVLYGWRFRECRYILLKMLAPLSGYLQRKTDAMKIEIYSIVTSDLSRKGDTTVQISRKSPNTIPRTDTMLSTNTS